MLKEKDEEVSKQSKEQKQLTGHQQRALEDLHQAHTSKIAQLEKDHRLALDAKQKELQSKMLEIRWLEDEVTGYEGKETHDNSQLDQLQGRIESLEADKRTSQTINQNLRQEADNVRAENNKLLQ